MIVDRTTTRVKDEAGQYLAMTSASASVTSSNSVCSPSNNPLHSSSCVHKFSPWRNHLECQDYLKVEAKHVAATQNCPNLTTWCRNSEDNLNERKILKLLMSRRIAPLTIPKRRPHKTEKANMSTYFLISSQLSSSLSSLFLWVCSRGSTWVSAVFAFFKTVFPISPIRLAFEMIMHILVLV